MNEAPKTNQNTLHLFGRTFSQSSDRTGIWTPDSRPEKKPSEPVDDYTEEQLISLRGDMLKEAQDGRIPGENVISINKLSNSELVALADKITAPEDTVNQARAEEMQKLTSVLQQDLDQKVKDASQSSEDENSKPIKSVAFSQPVDPAIKVTPQKRMAASIATVNENPTADELKNNPDNVPTPPVGVVREPVTQKTEKIEKTKEKKSYRHRICCLLGGIAVVGAALALCAGLKDGKNTEKQKGKNTPTQVEAHKTVGTYDQSSSEKHSRNQTIEKGFEKDMTADQARDLFIQQLGHRGEVLAIADYAAHNGIDVVKARQHVDEIQSNTRKMIGTDFNQDGRLSLTDYGKDRHTIIRTMLENASVSWVNGNTLQNLYNSGVLEGTLQNGRDDLLRINQNQGFDANQQVLKIELQNGRVLYLKGNCANFLWKGRMTVTRLTPSATVSTIVNDKGEKQIIVHKQTGTHESGTTSTSTSDTSSGSREATPPPKANAGGEGQASPGLKFKDPSKAPAGHDNGDHPAPTPQPTPDANADGVTGGTPQHPQPEATTPRPPESIPPVEKNPGTNQDANGTDGINNGTPQQQPKQNEV